MVRIDPEKTQAGPERGEASFERGAPGGSPKAWQPSKQINTRREKKTSEEYDTARYSILWASLQICRVKGGKGACVQVSSSVMEGGCGCEWGHSNHCSSGHGLKIQGLKIKVNCHGPRPLMLPYAVRPMAGKYERARKRGGESLEESRYGNTARDREKEQVEEGCHLSSSDRRRVCNPYTHPPLLSKSSCR